MASNKESLNQTLGEMDRQQLEIYAREVRQQFREERKLRGELDELNNLLEQHVRELEALNKMFQSHIEERNALEEAYNDLSSALEGVSEVGTAWADRVKSDPLHEV